MAEISPEQGGAQAPHRPREMQGGCKPRRTFKEFTHRLACLQTPTWSPVEEWQLQMFQRYLGKQSCMASGLGLDGQQPLLYPCVEPDSGVACRRTSSFLMLNTPPKGRF